MKKYKNFLFDFDGTIADTFRITFDVLNELAPYYRYNSCLESDIPALKNMTTQEILKKADLSFFKAPFLARHAKRKAQERVIKAKIFTGLEEILNQLTEENYKVAVLSSNSSSNIKAFWKHNNLPRVEKLEGDVSVFGKAKALKKFLKKQNWNIEETIYFGDEPRDVKACLEVGLDIGAVSWGFKSGDFLKQYNPTYLISDYREILQFKA